MQTTYIPYGASDIYQFTSAYHNIHLCTGYNSLGRKLLYVRKELNDIEAVVIVEAETGSTTASSLHRTTQLFSSQAVLLARCPGGRCHCIVRHTDDICCPARLFALNGLAELPRGLLGADDRVER